MSDYIYPIIAGVIAGIATRLYMLKNGLPPVSDLCSWESDSHRTGVDSGWFRCNYYAGAFAGGIYGHHIFNIGSDAI